jgi:hypothetical protein
VWALRILVKRGRPREPQGQRIAASDQRSKCRMHSLLSFLTIFSSALWLGCHRSCKQDFGNRPEGSGRGGFLSSHILCHEAVRVQLHVVVQVDSIGEKDLNCLGKPLEHLRHRLYGAFSMSECANRGVPIGHDSPETERHMDPK